MDIFQTSLNNALDVAVEKDLQATTDNGRLFFGLFDSPPPKRLRVSNHAMSVQQQQSDMNASLAPPLVDDFQKACLVVGSIIEPLNFLVQTYMNSSESPAKISLVLSVLQLIVTSLAGNSLDAMTPIPYASIFNYIHKNLNINAHKQWDETISFMIYCIRADPKCLDSIPTQNALSIFKHIMKQINTLPVDLSKSQIQSVIKGKDLINILLLGVHSDGGGCLSYYDMIVRLPEIYGNFVNGTFSHSIHWTMEPFINELSKRRRHLAYLNMPPDASWPLISQVSRRHEYNDLTTRQSYHMFEGDLIEFVKDGNSTSLESHFRDLLFQRASMDEYRQLIRSPMGGSGAPPHADEVRKAMVQKIKDVIRKLQEISNFEELREDHAGVSLSATDEDVKMQIPENIDFWELMIETADQLYAFVSSDLIRYESLLRDFYNHFYNSSGTPNPKARPKKDNAFIWLLLQLFHIDKINTGVILNDFNSDERLFGMVIQLYNETQITSKDAFYLRDLSLQCAMSHQRQNIKDRTHIKMRHPALGMALQYTPICYLLQQYFAKHYKPQAINHDIFRNLELEEIIKVATESQLRQNLVPDTLYVYLVPNKLELGSLAFPKATYPRGGALGYKLLDFLAINAKHRLLQLIYKMMLDSEEGPRFQLEISNQVNCISPYVLDVVYKLLYSAPCSAELMVKEIFDKLRRADKQIKTKAEGGLSLPDHTLRWLYTVLQLLNFRFLRFLKFSNLSSNLLHYFRFSLSALDNRQIYQVLEAFAINVMRMQIDVKVLQALADPNREKPVWFAESELLARVMVMSIAKLIKTRGQSDLTKEMIHNVLTSLYEYKLEWAPETLQSFPEAVRSFYQNPQPVAAKQKPTISYQKVIQIIQSNPSHAAFLLGHPPAAENEKSIKEYYSKPENRISFLCIIWTIASQKKSADSLNMAALRKLMLLIPPACMASYTLDLMDFILLPENKSGPDALLILDKFIWKYQLLDFNHVIFALVRGYYSPSRAEITIGFLRYLLLESKEFSDRVSKWMSLDFKSRYWTEDDHHDKLMEYLKQYPEFFEFNAYAMNGYEQQKSLLEPPQSLQLPVYYTNVVVRFITFFDIIISRLIEQQRKELLIALLDRYGILYQYHHYPLSFVRHLLHSYFSSPVLHEPQVLKRILKLLDFEQHDIASEIQDYALDKSGSDSMFDGAYFERVIQKLAANLDPRGCAPKSRSSLPERHFREISSPAVQALYVAGVEVMATPVPVDEIVKYILDFALVRGDHHVGVPAMTMHAVGLLLSSLPAGKFAKPIWEEFVNMMKKDPYLAEMSEPAALVDCSFMQQDSSDTIFDSYRPARESKAMMFPYIFNNYTFNVDNFSTNTANNFMTLFCSLTHYSSLDLFAVLLPFLRSLREGGMTTDVQLLYVCAVVGPVLHRIEKLPQVAAEYAVELMNMVREVTSVMEVNTTHALEQVYDFLFHIKAHFTKTLDTKDKVRLIIEGMKPNARQRLARLVI